MACVNMFNNEQRQGLYNTMSPRISFSNDFADPEQAIKLENSYREAPVSDFEFSIPNYTMNTADELFFKGKMVPLRENTSTKITTLKDELLNGDDEDGYENVSPRPVKGTSRWKQRLGLKRSNIVQKKSEKMNGDGGLESIDEMKTAEIVFSFKGTL